jgi:hypothetical protein
VSLAEGYDLVWVSTKSRVETQGCELVWRRQANWRAVIPFNAGAGGIVGSTAKRPIGGMCRCVQSHRSA